MREYELTLPGGPLSAGLQPVLLVGTGTLYAPQVSLWGGFDEYQPLDVIPPYATIILQFVP